MKNTLQKGSAAVWIIVIIVIAVVVYLIATAKHSTSTASNPNAVTIMVPSNVEAYKTAVANHVQQGTPDPLPITQFVATTSVPNTIVADSQQNVAEAAAEYIETQAGTSSLVTYFKVVNGTAYVVLNMDEKAWAGVSVAQAEVHPIVQNSLLALPGITAVKFGKVTGDTAQANQNAVSQTGSKVTPTPKQSVQSSAVTAPKGGETIKVGDLYTIKWVSSAVKLSTVNVWLVDYSKTCPLGVTGCNSSYLIDGPVSNLGSYNWNTSLNMGNTNGPHTMPVQPGAMYKIKICQSNSSTACVVSDNYFIITN